MNRFFITILSVLFFSFAASGQKGSTKMKSAKITRKNKVDSEGDSSVVYYGIASYYADKFTGRKTATGASYSHSGNTAACNILPLGTWVQVTNLSNGRSLIVQVNDRLHPKNKRLVDMTKSGAEALGYVENGVARVKLEVLANKKSKL
ncbi:MAG TPA: septal ring lytic transglycosylase RlpA family protein [Chitinophagaceae bacterium]|nr:septal ring lytic transglycosylase RlpA family protein [Chitinophagaceae bacterium]